MLLSTKPSSLDRLVALLARKPGLDIVKIQDALKQEGVRVSRPQLFRDLHDLQSAGVVVSIKGSYNLALAWVIELIHFSDSMHEQYLTSSQLITLLPEGKHRRSWKFFEFCRLSNFWNQLRLALVNNGGSQIIYEWLPHPWQHLIHHEKALLFYQALGKSRCRLKRIVGSSTYLDRLHLDSWPKQTVEHSFADSPFHSLQNCYLDVVGDYVFEINLIGRTFTDLEKLYRECKSKNTLKFERVTELLYEKGRFSAKLEYNPNKAAKLTRQFEEFFS